MKTTRLDIELYLRRGLGGRLEEKEKLRRSYQRRRVRGGGGSPVCERGKEKREREKREREEEAHAGSSFPPEAHTGSSFPPEAPTGLA
jgi:hypothetical protein